MIGGESHGLDLLRTHRDFPKQRKRSYHVISIFLEKHEKLKTLVYNQRSLVVSVDRLVCVDLSFPRMSLRIYFVHCM